MYAKTFRQEPKSLTLTRPTSRVSLPQAAVGGSECLETYGSLANEAINTCHDYLNSCEFNNHHTAPNPPRMSLYARPSNSSQQSSNMGSLFGGGSTAAANANPTQGKLRLPQQPDTTAENSKGDLTKDISVANPPEDSISAIRFSPASDHFAAASWDKKVRIYEVDQNGGTQGRALFEHEGPVLDCCWSKVSMHAQEHKNLGLWS